MKELHIKYFHSGKEEKISALNKTTVLYFSKSNEKIKLKIGRWLFKLFEKSELLEDPVV